MSIKKIKALIWFKFDQISLWVKTFNSFSVMQLVGSCWFTGQSTFNHHLWPWVIGRDWKSYKQWRWALEVAGASPHQKDPVEVVRACPACRRPWGRPRWHGNASVSLQKSWRREPWRRTLRTTDLKKTFCAWCASTWWHDRFDTLSGTVHGQSDPGEQILVATSH